MSQKIKRICWSVTLFLILNPIVSILLLVLYFVFAHQYENLHLGQIIGFALVYSVITNLSITMGYHRLFAHKSYEAHPVLDAFLLIISAGAFQGSALKWASDHRIHHRFEDTDQDPYSIKKGFWHAHMGWMMDHESVSIPIDAPDLKKNKMVMIQHQHYLGLAILVGYFLPLLVGHFLGSAMLGLIIGGGLRIFLTQQSTFFVNSLSHTVGKKPYSSEKTAKDSLLVAFLTHGEGFHNFHHKFQFDYRNGIRWYHWDPTKWSIQFAHFLGLAKKLKRVNFSDIIKARLLVESEKMRNSKFYEEKLAPLFEVIVNSQLELEKLGVEYRTAGNDKINQIKDEMRLAKTDLEAALTKWKILIRSYQVNFQNAQ